MRLNLSSLILLVGWVFAKAIASPVSGTPLPYLSLEPVAPLERLNSVRELQDVGPEDWAYTAFVTCHLSLVPCRRNRVSFGEPRFQYKPYSFRNPVSVNQGQRTLSPTDLETIPNLQQEYSAELASLRTQTHNLEARAAEITAHSFSTTTRLNGEIIFALTDTFGTKSKNDATASGSDSETTLNYRVRLHFDTSFSGNDLLRTRLQMRQTSQPNTGTAMSNFNFGGDNGGTTEMTQLYYRFPVADNITGFISAVGLDFDLVAPFLNPGMASGASGSPARFGMYNPNIYLQVGGAGAAVSVRVAEPLRLDLAYLTRGFGGSANDAPSPLPGGGIFGSTYSAYAQVTVSPTPDLDLAFAYVNAYYSTNEVNLAGGTGSREAIQPFGPVATAANHFGLQGSYHFSPLSLSGWVGYTNAEAKAGQRQGDNASIWNWAVTMVVEDLGKEGGLLGLSFGQPPKLTHVDGGDPNGDTSLHFQAFYRYPVTKKIDITPGFS
ncbi:iron uptake porin [[Phormidium] sp. ETS-05]|uniref:iron uptake porin n=1 Tax=[Phormidium] sp. ETS-05 TaxID=222819 RepID=UPI0018EEEE35|nr:iron uptake porin [[Phormidium] sp. ETS-05]